MLLLFPTTSSDKEGVIRTLLIGQDVDCFYAEKPKNNNNCVVYRLVSSVPYYDHSRKIYEKCRYSFDCYGTNLVNAKALGVIVKSLFDLNRTDFMFSQQIGEVHIKDIESGLYRDIVDFYIW